MLICDAPGLVCDVVLCSDVWWDVTLRVMYCDVCLLCTGDKRYSVMSCGVLCLSVMCCDAPGFIYDVVLCGEVW